MTIFADLQHYLCCIQNWNNLLAKYQYSKRKLFSFVNCHSDELSKSVKFWLSKSTFSVKNDANLCKKIISLNNTILGANFLKTSIYKTLYFLKRNYHFLTTHYYNYISLQNTVIYFYEYWFSSQKPIYVILLV